MGPGHNNLLIVGTGAGHRNIKEGNTFLLILRAILCPVPRLILFSGGFLPSLLNAGHCARSVFQYIYIVTVETALFRLLSKQGGSHFNNDISQIARCQLRCLARQVRRTGGVGSGIIRRYIRIRAVNNNALRRTVQHLGRYL